MGVVCSSLPSRLVEGTRTLEGGVWLVLATFGSTLENNLQNFKSLGGTKGKAMALALAMAKRMQQYLEEEEEVYTQMQTIIVEITIARA